MFWPTNCEIVRHLHGVRNLMLKDGGVKLLMFTMLFVFLMTTPLLSKPVTAQNRLISGSATSDIDETFSDTLQLYLEVFINGRSTDLIAEFSFNQATGIFLSSRTELVELGVKLGFGLKEFVSLDSIEGLTYLYDETRQALYLTLNPEVMLPQIVSANRTVAPVTADPTWGAVINYGARGGASEFYDKILKFDFFSISTNSWFFSPLGTVSNVAVYNLLPDGQGDFLRFETHYDLNLPSRALVISVGDIMTSALQWSRPIRLGGVQVRRKFGLRPDIVKEPLLSFSGAAAVPSTVDVFIDNNRVYSGQVNEGPYRFEDIPIYTGAGDALVVIQDETGEIKTREVPFFVSQNLLKPGIADWSIEAGYARKNYGIQSNDYEEDLLYAGSLRFGITKGLTIESHVEGSDDLFLWGGGVNMVIADAVELSFSTGQSLFKDKLVPFVYGSMDTVLWKVNVEASTLRAEEGFADLAYVTGIDAVNSQNAFTSLIEFPTALDVISVTLPTGQEGRALGLSYVRSSRGASTDEIISMNYTQPIRWQEASLNLSGVYDLQSDNTRISALLTVQFGNANAQMAAQRDTDRGSSGTINIYKPLGEAINDVGYSTSFDYGDEQRIIAAALQTRTSYGVSELSAQLTNQGLALQSQFDGAVVATGGRLMLGSKINDAFAIVDVGVPDISVYLQNREVALTNSKGRALVPGLVAYANNRLSINTSDMPLGVSVSATAADVVPAFRSGSIVDFDGENNGSAAILTLRLADGALVPVGSIAQLNSTREEFSVGYGGQVYVTNLSSFNALKVTTATATCTAEFSGPFESIVQNNLGEVICQ